MRDMHYWCLRPSSLSFALWLISLWHVSHSSVLQCVAVCCSVLQCAAVCCSVLQRVMTQFFVTHVTKQCVAVCCVQLCVAACYDSILCVQQCVAVCYDSILCNTWHDCSNIRVHTQIHIDIHIYSKFVWERDTYRDLRHCSNILQYTAIHCNTLQNTASYCNTLQYTATHCRILHHTATPR